MLGILVIILVIILIVGLVYSSRAATNLPSNSTDLDAASSRLAWSNWVGWISVIVVVFFGFY